MARSWPWRSTTAMVRPAPFCSHLATAAATIAVAMCEPTSRWLMICACVADDTASAAAIQATILADMEHPPLGLRRPGSSAQIQGSQIRGQPPPDGDGGPQQEGNGGEPDTARGDGPGRFPGCDLAPEGSVEISHRDTGHDDQRELGIEHDVAQILRRLRHPQREPADGLEHDRNPDLRDQLAQRAVRHGG